MATKPNIAEIRAYLKKAQAVEKYVVPAKLAFIAMSFAMLWSIQSDPGSEFMVFNWSLLIYTVFNIVYWGHLVFPSKKMLGDWVFFRSLTFLVAVMDNLFLCYLIFISETTIPLWLAAGLIIRNTVLFMHLGHFIVVNITLCCFYILAIYLGLEKPAFRALGGDFLNVLVISMFCATSWMFYQFLERRRKMLGEERELTIRVEKLRLAGRLAGEIAHELKNPLAIMNNAAYILGRSGQLDDPKSKKQLNIISSEIQRSDRIITELLDYARLAESQVEDIDVNEVALSAIEELSPSIAAKKIIIDQRLTYDLPSLFIDQVQLKQVFSNLLLNACDAVDEGGHIVITTSYGDNDSILIEVKDSGAGMDEETQARIFEPFYTTKNESTGLGLSIVNNVVLAYGGDVSMESEKGKGSTFLVKLPVRTFKQKKI